MVVYRFEDAPGALRSALLSELEQSASQQVMQALAATLRELPDELRAALEAMLHAPGDGPTVTALALGWSVFARKGFLAEWRKGEPYLGYET